MPKGVTVSRWMKMNRRSDMMRVAAMWISVASMVASVVLMVIGDAPCAGVYMGYACVMLLWAIIIKLEWL